MKEYKDISLLVTHYNRSKSLVGMLKAFHELGIKFGEIVISDDASRPEHIERLKNLGKEYKAKLVLAEKNGGLGNNINKGQKAVTLPYTLYIQEDFKPKKEFAQALEDSYGFMEEDKELDMVRYYSYGLYPNLIPFQKGFAYMNFSTTKGGYKKFFAYSDHPHLRRSTFIEKFGAYKEKHHADRTEYRMMIAYLQKKGKGLFYVNYKALFYHDNTDEEPSTIARQSWRRSNNFIIATVRSVYRNIRYNLNYLFGNYSS